MCGKDWAHHDLSFYQQYQSMTPEQWESFRTAPGWSFTVGDQHHVMCPKCAGLHRAAWSLRDVLYTPPLARRPAGPKTRGSPRGSAAYQIKNLSEQLKAANIELEQVTAANRELEQARTQLDSLKQSQWDPARLDSSCWTTLQAGSKLTLDQRVIDPWLTCSIRVVPPEMMARKAVYIIIHRGTGRCRFVHHSAYYLLGYTREQAEQDPLRGKLISKWCSTQLLLPLTAENRILVLDSKTRRWCPCPWLPVAEDEDEWLTASPYSLVDVVFQRETSPDDELDYIYIIAAAQLAFFFDVEGSVDPYTGVLPRPRYPREMSRYLHSFKPTPAVQPISTLPRSSA